MRGSLRDVRPVSEVVARVSRSAANLAKSTGLTKIGPVRRLGVFVMNRAVPDEEVRVTVVGDIDMFVNPKEDGRWYYFADQARSGESPEDMGWTAFVDEGDTVFDVGAHVGYMALVARDCVGSTGEVVAFEPLPSSFEKLQRNIELNGFENVAAEQVAVGSTSGSVELYPGDKTIRATTVSSMYEGRPISVDSTTIDEYVEAHNCTPDFVKINAEGVEHDVLRGMSDTLSQAEPNLAVEIHPHHLESQGSSAEQTVSFLLDRGYTVFTEHGKTMMTDSEARNLATSAAEPFTIIAKPSETS